MVLGNSVIAITAIEGDGLNRITRKGVVADGVIARTTIQIDVGETVTCLSKQVTCDRIGEGGAGERGIGTSNTLTLDGI